jgi:hypothetical protein
MLKFSSSVVVPLMQLNEILIATSDTFSATPRSAIHHKFVLQFKTNPIFAPFLLAPSYNFRPKRYLHCPYLYSATISDPPALLKCPTKYQCTLQTHLLIPSTQLLFDTHTLL